MAYTLQLTNRKPSATVLNLIGSTYDVQRNTLSLGTARVARVLTESLLRQGFNISAHTHVRRQMSFRLTISADSDENLVAAIQKINTILRQTREFSISGNEEQWWLQFNPGGSTGNVYFAIKDGRLALPPPNYNKSRWELDRPFVVGDLDLITDPLGEGDHITLPTVNISNDPTRTSSPFNYYTIDSSIIKGDQLAKLQLQIIEQKDMQKFWAGAEYGPPYNTPTDLVVTSDQFTRDGTGQVSTFDRVLGQSNLWSATNPIKLQNSAIYEDDLIDKLFNTLTTSIAAGSSVTKTFNNTSTKPNQMLFVFIGSSLLTGFSVKCNDEFLPEAGEPTTLKLFYLPNPIRGTNTIKITNTSSSTISLRQGSVFILTNVNLQNPFTSEIKSRATRSLTVTDQKLLKDIDRDLIIMPQRAGASYQFVNSDIRKFIHKDNILNHFVALYYLSPEDTGTIRESSQNLVFRAWGINGIKEDSPNTIETEVQSIRKGTYRVFAKLTGLFGTSGKFKGGLGYRYGDVVIDPKTRFDFHSLDNLADFGTLVIPPITAPKESLVGNINFRFYYFNENPEDTQANIIGLDALYLLKVDEGSAAVKKIKSGKHRIDIDTTIDPPSAIIKSRLSNVFSNRPEQSGAMIYVNPKGTRIYMLGDYNEKTNAWIVHGTLIPQYLHIA